MMIPTAEESGARSAASIISSPATVSTSPVQRSSLKRRIQKRMQSVHIEEVRCYRDYLEANPYEFAAAVQHDPDQRVLVLSREEAWEFVPAR